MGEVYMDPQAESDKQVVDMIVDVALEACSAPEEVIETGQVTDYLEGVREGARLLLIGLRNTDYIAAPDKHLRLDEVAIRDELRAVIQEERE